MKEYKKVRKEISWVAIFIIVLFIFSGVIISWLCSIFSKTELTPTCEETNIKEVYVNEMDIYHINEQVNDYYVKSKSLSNYYWYEVCNYLMKDKFNETLSQNKNLILYIDAGGSSYRQENNPDDIETLNCNYVIFWGDMKNQVEKGEITFDKTIINYAKENIIPIYNTSLVGVKWDEEIKSTDIYNYNSDYNVILNLKLNENICE